MDPRKLVTMSFLRKLALATAAVTLTVGAWGTAPASAALDSGWPCGGWCLTVPTAGDLP